MFGPSCVPAGRDPNEKGFSWDLESLREIITSMMDRFIDLIKVFPGPEAFQYLEIAKPPGHLNVITIGKRPEILDPLHLIDSDDGENWWMHTKNNRYLEEEAFRVESSPEMSPSPVTSSSSDSNQEINSITTPAALKQERIAQPPQYHHQKMPTKSSSKRQSIGILMPVTPNRPRTLQPSQISMMSPRTPCPVRARRSIIDDDYDAGSSSEADCWSGSRRSMGTSSGRNSSGFQSSRDFSSSSSEENSLTKANKTGLSAAFLYP